MVSVHPSLTPKQQLLKGENVTCACCNPRYLTAFVDK